MLVIPAIDLRAGQCVRLAQGRKDSAKVYDANPIEVARSFAAAGARMLHVVDLDGAFGEANDLNRTVLAEIIRSVDIRVQCGGGLREPAHAKEIIQAGANRIVIGSLAVEAPDKLKEILDLFGPTRVAVGIDSRNGQVMVRGWEKSAAISAIDLAQRLVATGVERIVYTDVARDGMLSGPNIDQSCLIASAGALVTASGGISSLDDLKSLQAVSGCGIDSVIVGKALYEGRFTLPEALAITESGLPAISRPQV